MREAETRKFEIPGSPLCSRPGMTECYKRYVQAEREAKAMTDMTYDAEADAVYITVGDGRVERTEEAGPFIYDVDAAGHIVGIEILSASKVLAPGDWKKPGSRTAAAG
jgi:uncharacterized protein YuzE